MKKILGTIILVFTITFLLSSTQYSLAITETIFEENFDGNLTGWSESLCDLTAPENQTCSIGQAKELRDPPNDPPNSLPYWGYVEVFDPRGGPDLGSIEIRYSKPFEVIIEDDYDIMAWIGTKDCSGCSISSKLFVDGGLVFEKEGRTLPEPETDRKFFEQKLIYLLPGTHNVSIGMSSTGAASGNFRASFDDIKIIREIPLLCGEGTLEVDNECIPNLKSICSFKNTSDLENLLCIPDLEEICGEGTIMQGMMCVAKTTMEAVGGELLAIDSAALFVAAIGVNPVVTGLVVITLAGVVGQTVWFLHKRKKLQD